MSAPPNPSDSSSSSSSSSSRVSSSLSSLPAYRVSSTELHSSPMQPSDLAASERPIQLTSLNENLYRAAMASELSDDLPSSSQWGGLPDVGTRKALYLSNSLAPNVRSSEFISPFPSSYSTFPLPDHVEYYSSFYSSADPSAAMGALLKRLEATGVAVQEFEGEAKIMGIAKNALVFSIKIFSADDSASASAQPAKGRFVVEVQRRSGGVEEFTAFYADLYHALKGQGIVAAPLNDSYEPSLSSFNPPALDASDDPNGELCALIVDMARSTNKQRVQLEALHTLGQMAVSSLTQGSADESRAMLSLLCLCESLLCQPSVSVVCEAGRLLGRLVHEADRASALIMAEPKQFKDMGERMAALLSLDLNEPSDPATADNPLFGPLSAQSRFMVRELQRSLVRSLAVLAKKPVEFRAFVDLNGLRFDAALRDLEPHIASDAALIAPLLRLLAA